VQAAARWGAGYKLAGLVHSGARWHGHRCVSAKSCPGDKAWSRIDDVADLTATYVRTGLPGAEEDDVTPAEIKAAVHAALGEKVITLAWDGGVPTKVSVYEALSFIHFNAADGSFVGTVPDTSSRAAQRGRDTHAAEVQGDLEDVAAAIEAITSPGEGDPTATP
jgi:hypothetical protein